MEKIWRYKGFDPETRKMKDGFEYKAPEVHSVESPGDDYEDVTTIERLIEIQSDEYEENEEKGKQYSRVMNSRLLILSDSIPSDDLSKSVRTLINGLFKETRNELDSGIFENALIAINKVEVSEDLQVLIDQYGLPINQEALIEEIKTFINLQINN